MRWISKKKGSIEDASEETSGKVIINIDIKRLDRIKRKVKIIVAATWASETLFKAEYETESLNDLHAATEAQVIAETFCKHENYIVSKVDVTGADMPVVKSIERGSRW